MWLAVAFFVLVLSVAQPTLSNRHALVIATHGCLVAGSLPGTLSDAKLIVSTATLGDFIYAARTLRSSRAFDAAAVITIGSGIGASTSIFSVANAVLLRPLPYKDPARLVYACTDLRRRHPPKNR